MNVPIDIILKWDWSYKKLRTIMTLLPNNLKLNLKYGLE